MSCDNSAFSVFTPPTASTWSKGTALIVKGTWAFTRPGDELQSFECDGDGSDPPACAHAFHLDFTSYSCKVNQESLDAADIYGVKPKYAQRASRYGAYVYNSIPGRVKHPKATEHYNITLSKHAEPGSLAAQTPHVSTVFKTGGACVGDKLTCKVASSCFDETTGVCNANTGQSQCEKINNTAIMSALARCKDCFPYSACGLNATFSAPPTCEDDASGSYCEQLAKTPRPCEVASAAKMCCKTCKRYQSGNSFDVTVLTNASSVHGAPVFTNLFFNSLLKSIRDDASVGENEFVQDPSSTTDLPVPEELRVSNWPFPKADSFTALMSAISALALALLMSMGILNVPPNFGVFVAREIEFKQKHQQYVSGLSPLVYWLSNFTYDMFSMTIVLAVFIILILAFEVSTKIEGRVRGRRERGTVRGRRRVRGRVRLRRRVGWKGQRAGGESIGWEDRGGSRGRSHGGTTRCTCVHTYCSTLH